MPKSFMIFCFLEKRMRKLSLKRSLRGIVRLMKSCALLDSKRFVMIVSWRACGICNRSMCCLNLKNSSLSCVNPLACV